MHDIHHFGGNLFFLLLASATKVSYALPSAGGLTLNRALLRRALAALLPKLNLFQPVFLLLVHDEVLRVSVLDPFDWVELGRVVVGEDMAL
jgi:hypothetical protein